MAILQGQGPAATCVSKGQAGLILTEIAAWGVGAILQNTHTIFGRRNDPEAAQAGGIHPVRRLLLQSSLALGESLQT